MKDIYSLGVVEYMKLLRLLHKEGYQQLRWFSYFAPNGCFFRCQITTQDNLYLNRDIVDFDKSSVWATSVRRETTCDDVERILPLFKAELGLLLEKGKGEDEAYAKWFEQLLERVLEGKGLPLYNDEYFLAPIGHLKQGKDLIQGPPMSMTLISWNIDGVKAHFDSLKILVEKYNPDIICLQKTKDSKSSSEIELPGYSKESSQSPYAGVLTFVKDNLSWHPVELKSNQTTDGHLLIHEFLYPHFFLFNVYTPYSNPKIEGAVEHRKEFDKLLLKEVLKLSDRKILCGDMNIVMSERDCWDKKHERNQANFHLWEREAFLKLLDRGSLFDTYRTFHLFESEYSYFFRNDKEVRAKNQGYRIDYFLASRSLEPNITRAEILKDFAVTTNDPILLKFNY